MSHFDGITNIEFREQLMRYCEWHKAAYGWHPWEELKCAHCGEKVALINVYRCYDCSLPMHQECCKRQCNESVLANEKWKRTQNMAEFKPTICIDFDGVIHKYSKGWQDGEIYDDIVPGFIQWAERALPFLTLVIYSSRSKTPEGIVEMKAWLRTQVTRHFDCEFHHGSSTEFDRAMALLDAITFADTKPAAWLTIDDRAVQFNGNWNDTRYAVEAIRDFKPWNSSK